MHLVEVRVAQFRAMKMQRALRVCSRVKSSTLLLCLACEVLLAELCKWALHP